MKALNLLYKQALAFSELHPEQIAKWTGIHPKHIDEHFMQSLGHLDLENPIHITHARNWVAARLQRERAMQHFNQNMIQTGQALKKVAPYAGGGLVLAGGAAYAANA